MKLLHIVGDSKFGGGSIIILQLARLALDEGWTVSVLTTDPVLQNELKQLHIESVPLDVIKRSIHPVRDLRGLWVLYRYLKKQHYEMVHTHTSKAGFVGRVAARLAGVPLVVHTAHGFAFHERSGAIRIRACALLERIAAWCCDRVFTVSEFHRAWAIDLGIAGPDKIVAIPNGVAAARVRPSMQRDLLREELAAQSEDTVVLCSGRLAHQKGLDELLGAVASLKRTDSLPLKLWFAGDGPLRCELEARAAELCLGNDVRFLGFCDNVADLLAASDIVALPTYREGMSIALLEAMAAGRPIVTTSIGSNLEATQNGKAALLVPPGNVLALADAIRQLACNKQAAQDMAQQARKTYLSLYTVEQMLSRYREEYVALKASAAPPSRKRTGTERSHAATKRLLDILISATALVLLGPLMLLIALAVRLASRGPALFRQQRLGRDGSAFTVYKFRTMFQDAADIRNPDGSAFTGRADPRVTSLGRFLRATSLDELPQLINVLRGEMSLVGPRPDQLDQIRYYTPTELNRLRVKPGITGLAQLSGRNSISWMQRKQLDLEYVERQSLWLDLEILLKTAPYVVMQRGVFEPSASAEPKLPDGSGQ
ncbi:MAG: glycosyl transferase, group 1 [Bryobacterales bacterium]|jgi:lipopolysaccharide/colanic/teichoic acid biosynthesis glycosyltransferase/glycosyltransferase involved in cell wall biosynthesis|nr:glycosyl transferase, group 1 [Bryobacterales bacterium]